MAYRFRGRGHFTAEQTRSGQSFVHTGRRVTIDGDHFQLNWNGPQLVEVLTQGLVDAINNVGDDALNYMKSVVPVDTGALRDSCYAQVSVDNGRLKLEIGATAPYAIYVELGTYKMAAQPYIRPTFDYLIRLLPVVIKAEVARRASSAA